MKPLGEQTYPGRTNWRLVPATLVFVALLVLSLTASATAPAQDLQSELDQSTAKLSRAKSQDGVLTTTIQRYPDRIDRLRGQVASLQAQEASVQAQLDEAQAQLEAAVARLTELRSHLNRALDVLAQRLVSVYKTGEPDLLTVALNSDGFDDLASRSAYLNQINSRDSTIVGRVRDLRDEADRTVTTVRTSRDVIASKRAELASTHSRLAAEQSRLSGSRAKNRAALAEVRATEQDLSDHVAKLQGQIASQLQAAGSPGTLPAGPIKPGSGRFIWPVNGPITSPFGPRWGSFHPGLDIGAPSGTPIRAAAAGTVILMGPNGGYGNFTCLNHSDGFSTCYAHQTSFATSLGASVAQGQVIGYVGSTGFSTGPHLHFEVRVNGAAQDPLGYL